MATLSINFLCIFHWTADEVAVMARNFIPSPALKQNVQNFASPNEALPKNGLSRRRGKI